VLIVDDDPGIAALERARLEQAGYRVVAAETADGALRALGAEAVDLILLDYRLPDGVDGLEFYARVKAAGFDVPVILVTGFSSEATVIRALRVGVRDFVTKSLEYLDYLPDAVGRVLGQVRTEHQLASIIATAQDAVIIADWGGRITLFNPAAERMFRCPAADAAGRPVGVFSRAAPAAAGGGPAGPPPAAPDRRGVRRGGEEFPLEVSVSRGEAGGQRFVTLIARDVTDRERMEGELRRTAELLKAVADGTADAVFVKDRAGRYLFANPATVAFVGRPAAEIIGRTDADLFDPDGARVIRAHDRAAMASDTALTAEETLTAGGATRTFLVSKAAYRTGAGDVAGVIGISRDVTERTRLAAERDALLARLRLQIERMPLAYILFGPDLRCADWNPAAERIFGYDREEARRLDPFALTPATVWPELDRLLARIRAGDMRAHAVNEALTKDGRTIICEWYNTPITGDDGRFNGFLCLAQDVTARRAAEDALLVRDRAIRAVTQGIVIADALRPDAPIVFASPAFERLTGYAADEVLGRNCRFLQGRDTDRAAVARVREAIRDGRAYTVELLNYRKDGAPFWNELSISPVRNDDGRLTHFVGVQNDVTGRRALEDQFRQAQKMEAIGQLAGGIAHDFNNLLTVINGFSELVLRKLGPGDPHREAIAEVRGAGERAVRLTRGLLTFGRKDVVEPVVLDLNAVVTGTCTMLRWIIGEQVRLVTELAPGLDRVRVDVSQIEQVIVNLAVNARDAMPDGGTLTVATANAELGEADCRAHPDARPGRYVRLAVTDTGVGMTEEVRGRIFEPFFTTKGVGKGTGLGLATVYGIARRAGATVRVSSAVGRGSTFELHFPSAGAGADAPPPPARPAADPPGRGTVLVVDDDDHVRHLILVVLRAQGYQVLEAPGGAEALQACATPGQAIDLLLTDIAMPGMGGPQLAEEVARLRPGTKTLFVSGYPHDTLRGHGAGPAGVGFLQKPFSIAALAEKVRAVLARDGP
jgi:PAS domain S-box-containing protein